MLRVLSVFGTRPEAIKMAPVLRELEAREGVESLVCVTAQHRGMLDQMCALFGIRPDFDLDLMRPDQSLCGLAAAVLGGLDQVLAQVRPHWVLVQGDTTTVMAASLAAVYHRCRVGHVEAGLRTGDRGHPWPEEYNRRVTDAVSDLYFAPTPRARDNLLRENVPPDAVLVTGNTVIDALGLVLDMPHHWEGSALAPVPRDRRIVLVTAHRRESFGPPFLRICQAVRDLARRHRDTVFVYPVHPNPHVRATAREVLSGEANVLLLEPLGYQDLVRLMGAAHLVLTDSGGIQEEAPGLGRPVLVLRETTERPEAVESGCALLTGTDRERIVAEAHRLLTDPAAHAAMAQARNPFGDGQAARRIVEAILGTGGG